jgi:HEPN domain-containing protein
VKSNVKYWVAIVEYDLQTAKAMLKTKRWLYVGFMCHQVIEKILKAYYTDRKNELPPYIHNLFKLASLSNLDQLMSEAQLGFLDEIEPLNIQARYPSYKDDILKKLSPKVCKELLAKTEQLKIWIEKQLKK